MALVVKDRVKVTTATTGTGTLTLGSAVTKFQDFSVVGDGNTTYYAIESGNGTDWEVGVGTYTASGTTLSRDTILESSNGGTAISLSGTSTVFCTYPAERSVNTEDIGVTVQAYDADTTKNDVANTFTANQTINANLTVDTNTLYVDSTNNRVGIGTTSPTMKLDVSGGGIKIGFQAAPTWDTNSFLWTEAGVGLNIDGFNLKFNTGVTRNERMRIDQNGNVGIGTTTFNYGKLEVADSGYVAYAIRSTDASGAVAVLAANSSSEVRIGSITSHPLSIRTANTERMVITSTGNVGIGTSSPSTLLEVSGSDATSVSVGTNLINTESGAGLSIAATGTTFSTAGWMGLQDGIILRTLVGASGGIAITTGGAAPIIFGPANTERMRIDSSGNVGIGTTAPTQKLDVSGTVNATAFIGDGSALTNITDTVAPTRHSIQPSLNLDFANSKKLDPRITFTRASNATYYDGYTSVKAEENFFTYSQDFTNAAWSSGRLDKFADDTTAPDGTTTADRLQQQSGQTTSGYVQQLRSVLSNLTYTQSGYFKAGTNRNFVAFYEAGADGTGNLTWFNLSTGAVGTKDSLHTAAITDVGNGWYRCSVTFTTNANRSPQLNFYIAETDGSLTVTDNQGFIYGWGAQFEQRDTVTSYTPTTSSPITKYQPALQTAGNNVARFDHNPDTGESLGLLIEESRTNLVSNSEILSAGAGTTVIVNTIIAPDGTLTADRLVENTNNGEHYSDKNVPVTSGTTYTFSAYYKKDETSQERYVYHRMALQGLTSVVVVNLDDGSIIIDDADSSSVTDVGNGWYRVSSTKTATGTGTSVFRSQMWRSVGASVYTGDGYSGFYVWGVQVEEGSFPTSYIKTTGSQVTRSADDCEMLNIDQDDWLKQGAGTLYGEFSKPYVGETNGVPSYASAFALTNDQFDTNAISVYVEQDITPRILTDILFSNSSQYNVNIISPAVANTYYKTAIAYERNNVDSSGDGSDETTDTSAEIPFINRLRIFKRVRYQSNGNYATIKKLSYYPIKLTKNEVIDLTEE